MQQTRKQIKQYLEKGHSLNSLKAFKIFGTLSLQQHIHALRRQGAPILGIMISNPKTKKRFSEYWIEVEK